ncbi:YidC/Oxa1 family membrane protein insertase [Patescibacteria group bacterium]|nr:YidC/Oxa1 family membrane protein insertase [Patescibacteria group bacterium]
MKRFGLIFTTLGLFALSVYLAFIQGNASLLNAPVEGTLHGVSASPLIYSGFKAEVAKLFVVIMNSLLTVTGKSVLLSIILLALSVELVLLYPSFRIQLKQKKIHLFHKKLVDRFNKGELSVSQTEDELHKLYDVNEKIHHRGATIVMIQMALFFFTFWGLNLMVKAPGLLTGSWSILNFSLLTPPVTYALPLTASLLYFAHACTKLYFKQREDYISSAQTTIGALFAVIGTVIVYVFAGVFATALTVYFITLIAFATVRYIVVERHARKWGQFAQRELIQMLREAGPHKDRFQYFSRLWNHIPIVRHINFNLLEESLSMTLGLLLALSFFGAFQNSDQYMAQHQTHPAKAVVEITQLD